MSEIREDTETTEQLVLCATEVSEECESREAIVEMDVDEAISEIDEDVESSVDSDNNEVTKIPKLHRITDYHRKRILDSYEKNGFKSSSLKSTVSRFKGVDEMIYAELCKKAKDAQNYVYQECESPSFDNISDWLELMSECKTFEPAIVLKTILNNEKQPDPALSNNVDLTEVYTFLVHGLTGMPQKTLSLDSMEFLQNEFKALIDLANDDKADEMTKLFYEQMERLRKTRKINSFDPLNLLNILKETQ